MPNYEEIRDEVTERWQIACRELVFCHSPNVVLHLVLQGILEHVKIEQGLDHWEIVEIYAAFDPTTKIIEHEEIWNLKANARARVTWTISDGMGSLSQASIHLSYESDTDPDSKENKLKKAMSKRLFKRVQEERSEEQRMNERKKTRWGRICSEVSSDAKEHEQEDGPDTD